MAVSYLLHSFLGMYLMMPVVAMDEPFEQVPLPRFCGAFDAINSKAVNILLASLHNWHLDPFATDDA